MCFAFITAPGLARMSDAERYEACMAEIALDAEKAFDEAIAWQGLGGGSAAGHCAAAALFRLGYNREAATRLEALAQEPQLDGRLKPEILRQAAQAWLEASEPERAFAALTSGLDLDPDDPALWRDRGIVLADIGLLDEALDDLSRAIVLSPDDASAWLMRGSAYRLLENHTAAMRDIAESLRIDPANPEAYLERGNLRRLQGDDDGAREDWMVVIRHDSQSALADTARANIEHMDVGN